MKMQKKRRNPLVKIEIFILENVVKVNAKPVLVITGGI
jgi:hypothetical protein